VARLACKLAEGRGHCVISVGRRVHLGRRAARQERRGGLTVAAQLAAEPGASDREIVTHSWLTDLLRSYSVHCLATLPNATWVEFNVAQSRGVVGNHLSLSADGTVSVPDGIGVEVDEDFVRSRQLNEVDW
jgi:L-alanine-DL-glutamate epimerase-like enolase superfamily enzyme